MKVEFVTLGDAAKRLDVPAPTLRGWSDRLEDLEIHYLERNHRNERIFYKEDMDIFKFMKENKDKYGRKSTTTDLAYVILEKEDLICRGQGAVPEVPRHKAELSELDMNHLLENPNFQFFMQEVINKATEDLSDEISDRISNKLKEEMDNKINEIEESRIKRLDELLEEQRATRKIMQDYFNLPAYKRLFKKNPLK